GNCALPAADCLAVFGDRPASQPAPPEIRERAHLARKPGRRRHADDRRCDREHLRQAGRSATPALLGAQRHRPGNLHLDRAAEPQHPRAARPPRLLQQSRLAAARSDRHHGAVLQFPRRRRRKQVMARILVAEDDEAIRGLVVRALTEDGHELTAAADGSAALAVLDGSDTGFDLLLTDVKMPAMDGIALAMAAGREHPDLAIMLMTGYADMRERAH